MVALGGANLLARNKLAGRPGRRIKVANKGTGLGRGGPLAGGTSGLMSGLRELALHSRGAYRVFSLTAVWSRLSISSKQRPGSELEWLYAD